MTDAPYRIAPKQAPAAKAKQALMIGSDELGAFTYICPYQIGDEQQRLAVEGMFTNMGHTLALPDDAAGVFYLIVMDSVPIMVPETDAVAFTMGVVLARLGLDAARRVSYRSEMLPAPKG